MSAGADEPGRGHARPIGEVIRAVIRRKRFHEKAKYGPIAEAWAALVGPQLAQRTRVDGFKAGELIIGVDGPALLHELNGFRKADLTAALQQTEAGRQVVKIRFRLIRP